MAHDNPTTEIIEVTTRLPNWREACAAQEAVSRALKAEMLARGRKAARAREKLLAALDQ